MRDDSFVTCERDPLMDQKVRLTSYVREERNPPNGPNNL
jgi:hypothetical protein